MGSAPVIAVIGGYGAAGREICLLLKELYAGPSAELRVAGRARPRAEALCRELETEYEGPLRFVPARTDVDDADLLRSLISDASLILAALQLSPAALEVVGGRLKDGADYIDILPGLSAARVLGASLERQTPRRSRVIVGTGSGPFRALPRRYQRRYRPADAALETRRPQTRLTGDLRRLVGPGRAPLHRHA